MSLTSSVTAQQASGGFAPDRPGAIRIDTVSHRYGHGRESVTALGPVSIDVTPGEFLVLVGASGCGKSTLLRLIAGFESPSSGTVQVSGSDPIPGSSAGVVFQQPRLFPWKSVGGNIDLALKYAGVAKSERGQRRDELLDRVGLVGTADRRIWEISGGQQQRVAIARAWRPKRRCSCWTNPLPRWTPSLASVCRRTCAVSVPNRGEQVSSSLTVPTRRPFSAPAS